MSVWATMIYYLRGGGSLQRRSPVVYGDVYRAFVKSWLICNGQVPTAYAKDIRRQLFLFGFVTLACTEPVQFINVRGVIKKYPNCVNNI